MKLLAEIHPDYCPSTKIFNWASPRTGLQVVLVKKATPAVNGYFAVATEILNSSGCPHTLEHLVFMGSEKYPYKGLLDIVGAKQMSSTNAWTGQDQTVYTLTTAGWQGFSSLLPVYIDHVLNATLTGNGFVTEVFHIDGDGQERGVVFSEMQGVENTSAELIAGTMQRLIHPKDSGYSTNTGGLLKALRGLTNSEIRAYHEKCYKPSNLSIIITGDVEPSELIAEVEKIDATFPDAPSPPEPRPFVDSKQQPQPLKATLVEEMDFPEKDESMAEALISWVGPPALNLLENTALQVLGEYFTLESVGKFTTALMDIADPVASDIQFYTDDYVRTGLNFYVGGIPVEKLGQIDGDIMAVIGKEAENLDMDMIKDCIEHRMNKFILDVENDPSTFAYLAIDNFLYGSKDGSTLKQWTASTKEYNELRNWSKQQWTECIQHNLIANHHATVLGRPSRKLYEQFKVEKKERLEEIKQTMDLEKLGKQLHDAKTANEQPIPDEVLEAFEAPDPAKVRFIHTKSAATALARSEQKDKMDPELQALIDKEDVPLAINFESYASQFVTIKIYFSAANVDPKLLPLIDVLLNESFAMPMKLDDGTELTFEQVAQEVARDAVVNSLSTNSYIQEYVMVEMKARSDKYARAIMWIQYILFNVVFDEERLNIFITKHLNSLVDEKRDGSTQLVASIYENMLTDKSLRRQSEGLLTEEYFKDLDDMSKVHASLQKLREQLYKPENMRILVAGDIPNLDRPVGTWQNLYERFHCKPVKALTPVPSSAVCRTPLGKQPKKRAVVTVCPASESSYLSVVTSAPTSYTAKDLAELSLCCGFLQVTEGPLWKQVRGAGLAYGARFYVQIETGQLVCNFYRATDALQALAVTKKLVTEFADGTVPVDKDGLDRAVLSHVSDTAADRGTYSAAITQKFFDNVLRKRGPDFIETFIKAIQKVTPADIQRVLQQYVLGCFSPETSALFVVAHPSDAEALESGLRELGYAVEVNEVQDSDESGESGESGDSSGSGSDSSEYDSESESD